MTRPCTICDEASVLRVLQKAAREAGVESIGTSHRRREVVDHKVSGHTLEESPGSLQSLDHVDKSFMAQALGYAAARAGYSVRFIHADDYFKAMSQARADNSVDKTFRSFLTPDLLILDDLGLHRLTAQQSDDFHQLVIGKHRASSFVITSNPAIEEWLGLFNDPILGNSALDHLANASYQIVIEGASYRERLSPHRALLGEVVTSLTKGGD